MAKKLSILIVVVLFISCGSPAKAPDARPGDPGDLNSFLPAKVELGSWKAADIPREFGGDDLYVYMDGGAAIYHEYGFRQLLVQDYADADNRSLTLEIFEMAEPEAAFGIYTSKTSPHGESISLGQDGMLEDYYLNFWKARYLITVTGFDRTAETLDGVLLLGRLVDSKIPSSGARRPLVDLLPKKDLIAASIKYFRGPLALFQEYPFTTTDAFGIKAGVKGDYLPGYSFFLIRYETVDQSAERFAAAADSLRLDSRFSNFRRSENNTVFLEDRKGRCLGLRPVDRLISIVLGQISADSAASLLDDFGTEER